MDDVILMASGTLLDWPAFDVILETFCKASGMSISIEKYCFLYNNIASDCLNDFVRVLPCRVKLLQTGFNYLGYFLKPLGYRVSDWIWLVQKFEKRICNWSYKLLSLGGRLILVQSVLSSIPVYWMGLAPIPTSILHKLRSIMFDFLWGSSDNKSRYHLVSWRDLSWPKELGGWGIKNIQWFSISLCLKNLWRVLHNEGLWHKFLFPNT